MFTPARQSAQLTSTCRQFTTRDSATSFLRRQGITKDLYNDFITNFRGKMVIDTTKVDLHIQNDVLGQVATTPKPTCLKPETIKQTAVRFFQPTPKPTRLKPETIETPKFGTGLAAQIRELIVTTKMTNDEIFRHLNLDADKKTYPAWYRGQLARRSKV